MTLGEADNLRGADNLLTTLANMARWTISNLLLGTIGAADRIRYDTGTPGTVPDFDALSRVLGPS